MLKRNNLFFIIIFILININSVYSNEIELYSVNKLISSFKLNIEYDQVHGKITLSKSNKKVLLLLDSPYVIIGNKKYFINEFVTSEQGQFYIPQQTAVMISKYFSGEKIFSQVSKKETIIDKTDKYYLNSFKQTADIDKKDKKDSIFVNDKKIEITEKEMEKVKVKEKYIFEKEPDKVDIKAIIIDPGHGGNDPGAIGYSGVKEKDVVLRTALILAEKLKKKYTKKKIILTRNRDVFIPLDKRAKIANYVFNKYGNTLFISIHVNASRSNKPYGFETWYLVEKCRRSIIKKGEISEDEDVEDVLNAMLNDEIYKESKELANTIQKSLEKNIGYVSLNRGIKEQTYFVIKKSIMPAVLVEIGFNTNKYEEIRLTKYSYLNKIAQGIFRGIMEFTDVYERTSGYTK